MTALVRHLERDGHGCDQDGCDGWQCLEREIAAQADADLALADSLRRGE